MDLPVSINTLGALVTLGLGLMGLFAPRVAAGFADILPGEDRGLSEIRATYGGLFLAMGLWALVAQSTAVFRVVGIAWFGAAAGRAYSYALGESRSASNLGGIAMEAVVGLLLFVPWDSLFGS